MQKIIRGSRRGLTFSLPDEANGQLPIGAHYDYVIDTEKKTIRLSASEEGRYTVSRKRAGHGWRGLVDLRNQEVLTAIAGMKRMRVTVTETEVIVTDADACVAKKAAKVLVLPRVELQALRMAAGMDTGAAVESVLTGAQITLDEYLSSTRRPLDVSSIHTGLADVYTVVSLFSGAGILDWPFFQDGRFSIRYAIDYEASACETYRANIGPHIVNGDVHKAFTDSGYPLDDTVQSPDLIIGGPSCKPFSNANRHTRLDDHKDSDLLLQYMRIVQNLKPKVFAIENVPAVLTACDGAYFKAIKEKAAECGYVNLEAKIVQDNLVGGYTTRRRVVIVGSLDGKPVFPDLSVVSDGHTAGEALGQVTPAWYNYNDVTLPGEETKRRMSFVPQGGNYTAIPEAYQTPGKNRHSSTYRRLAWNEPSPTLVNWRKPPLIHPTEDRTLTVAEAKALHGLPGSFRVCGTLGQMQQQVGNSVPVAIGRYIKNVVLRLLQRMHQSAFCAV